MQRIARELAGSPSGARLNWLEALVARLIWLEAIQWLAVIGWKPFGGSPQLAGSHAVARLNWLEALVARLIWLEAIQWLAQSTRVRASARLQMLLGGCEERYGVTDCPVAHTT